MAPVLAAAERHGIPVIEDASEALGASYRGGPHDGRAVGTIGRIGCFSFNGNKLITTGGGGMLVTDDEALARRARHLSTQARLPQRAYDHDEVGYNYRLSNLAAALGVAQLETMPDLLAGQARQRPPLRRRDRVAARGAPGAAGHLGGPVVLALHGHASIRTATDATRDDVIEALAAEAIEARPIWTPLHLTRLYADAPRLGGARRRVDLRHGGQPAVVVESGTGRTGSRRRRRCSARLRNLDRSFVWFAAGVAVRYRPPRPLRAPSIDRLQDHLTT